MFQPLILCKVLNPFHKKPNWSCVYTSIKLDNGIEGLSVCFTSGAGLIGLPMELREIAKLFKDFEFNKFINDPGSVYKLIK